MEAPAGIRAANGDLVEAVDVDDHVELAAQRQEPSDALTADPTQDLELPDDEGGYDPDDFDDVTRDPAEEIDLSGRGEEAEERLRDFLPLDPGEPVEAAER